MKARTPIEYRANCEFLRGENSRLARENALLRELFRLACGDARADELLRALTSQLHAVPSSEVTDELHRRGVPAAHPIHHDAPIDGAEGVLS